MPKPLGFEFEKADDIDEKLTAWSGLAVVYEALMAMGVIDSLRQHLRVFRARRNLEFDEADYISALVLLFVMGGDCFDDLTALRQDAALSRLLERSFPSPEAARQFLYLFHEDGLVEAAQQALPLGKKAYVPEESAPLQALGRVGRDLTAAFQRRWPAKEATLDIDTTFQESHKREAKQHYQEGPGYEPLLAYWKEQKLVVFDQFRDGNVPSHFGVLSSVQQAFASLPAGIESRRLRADSAVYVIELLRWLAEEKIAFAIGVRMRDSLLETCQAVPEASWKLLEVRADSQLHLCEVAYQPKEWRPQDGLLRFLAIRLSPLQSPLFDEPRSVKYLAVVTNRPDPAADIVHWYWDKGGTIEHVHDVLKNDLGAGTLPCGRFGTNAAWLRANVLAFNILEVLKRVGPTELRNAKPKRLRFTLLAIPALVINHARQVLARMAGRGDGLLVLRRQLWQAVPT
jgi:hypothetical protein